MSHRHVSGRRYAVTPAKNKELVLKLLSVIDHTLVVWILIQGTEADKKKLQAFHQKVLKDVYSLSDTRIFNVPKSSIRPPNPWHTSVEQELWQLQVWCFDNLSQSAC